MPKSVTQEAFTTFIRGLNTEAGELTFPKDASVDESNCLLERAGNRRRRLGLHYETAYNLSTETYAAGTYSQLLTWKNVGGEAGKEFVVVQIGGKLRFYENSSPPLSEQVVNTTLVSSTPYIVDLSTYATGSSVTEPVQVTSIKGALVVVSSAINPFYIERDTDTGAFTETEIKFRVRDFEWLGELNGYFSEVSSSDVSIERHYDTLNAGWHSGAPTGATVDPDLEKIEDFPYSPSLGAGTDALDTYISARSAYPPLTHPWYAGKNSNGNFSVSEWQEIYAGTSRIGNGHFIYNLLEIDRDSASGLTGVPGQTEPTRFSTVASFAGRTFYAGMSSKVNASRIYYSQQAEELNQLGDCLQLNDPTSENLSDLLDTDGGYLAIPEAHNVKKLHVFGPALFVFAENGVWRISGVDDVFRATEYSVSKVSDVGIDSLGSFVSADGRPYWWSFSGIHTIVVTESGGFKEQNLSLTTIQSFWNDIETDQKERVSGTYDSLNNKVYWFYEGASETVEGKYNEVLLFDEQLKAFYPWTISDTASNTPQVIGATFVRGVGRGTITYNVVDSSGDQVQDSSGNDVIVDAEGRTDAGESDVRVLVRDNTGSIVFAEFDGTDFLDWESADYSSYAEAGYNFQGDMTTYKTSPFVTVYLRRTETGWTGTEVTGYDPIRPSSLKVSAFIDFKSTSSGSPQQAYRLKFPVVVDSSDLTSFDYPHSVISTRLKVRGRGRSYRLRFESEQGKDFNLLGWEVIGLKNGGI